jgi:serine/threonine protein kinase
VGGVPTQIYEHTKQERQIYARLIGEPGAADYIMPYLRGNENANSAYINFAWKDGMDMIDYLNTHPQITRAQRHSIIHSIADSLRWLASKGFIHRDIKFDNLYWDNTNRRILLLDFGMAKPIDSMNKEDLLAEVFNFMRKIVEPLRVETEEVYAAYRVAIETIVRHMRRSDANPNAYKNTIITFYNAMIDMFAPPAGQQGGRRRQTRRHRRR